MPSAKSNKKSSSSSKKSSSRPSSSSSSSSQAAAESTTNPDGGEVSSQEELSRALEEASRKFPCLISQTAFVGQVSDAEPFGVAANSSSGGCKIWMSESAMLASNITPGSIVSVSLASSSRILSSFPLSSLALECAKCFGFDFAEDLADEAGIYFTLATVFPSCKVSKNAVRLSSNLTYTMGFPHTGRTVFVYPLHIQPPAGIVNGNDKLHGAITSYFPSLESKTIYLSLITSMGKFAANSIKLVPAEANVRSDNGVISSPKTPSLSHSKLGSSRSSELSTPRFKGSMTDAPDLYGSSINGVDVKEVLEDDASKKLLQTCITSWLFSRNLLPGNLVIIPILSSLIVFQVTDASKFTAKSNSQNLVDGNSHECFPITVGHGTNIQIDLLDTHWQQTSNRRIFSYADLERGNVRPNVGVDASKLGGLSKEFTVLKDIIVSSILKGTLAGMGLRPTKGVLLHGPPGTGKTSLARLCVQDAGVNLFSINGPEIVSQYYGESEKALHEVFDLASQAPPAVVFIDELDAIAPARKEGGEELSQRMVATLLSLMDGISRSNGLLVIAATNRPDSIEAALRRPGRLDREIEIGVPSPMQRYEILLCLLSEMEHTLSSMDIQHLATATHGSVGADLAALCNEAALVCLRRYIESEACALLDCQPSSTSPGRYDDVMGNSDFLRASNGESVKDHLQDASSSNLALDTSLDTPVGYKVDRGCKVEKNSLVVAFEDFEKARMRIRPSAMREVILEVPKVRWEDVGGQREVKMQLMEAVEWPQKHQDAFMRIGTRPPTGVLMFGPPGCSKTLLARAVASESGLNFLAVKGPELFSKWVGESEKAVRSLFAKARANAPSIIFFDEIDGLAVIRGKESDGVSVADRVMSQLLVELDGLHQRVDVTVVAATNRPDKIDPALLRPGRFDRLIYVGPPNRKDREDIFCVHLRKTPCSVDVCIEELALLTEGFTGADISLVCREAAIAAIEESLDASEITMKHLKDGIKQVQPSEIQSYQKLSTKFQRHVQSTAEEDGQSSQLSPSRTSNTKLWTILNSIAHFLWRFPASLLHSNLPPIR